MSEDEIGKGFRRFSRNETNKLMHLIADRLEDLCERMSRVEEMLSEPQKQASKPTKKKSEGKSLRNKPDG